ncbi:MAG: MotE family protein [Thalassobaculum sp.]
MSYDRMGRRAAPPMQDDAETGGASTAPVSPRAAAPNAERLARGRAAAAAMRAAQKPNGPAGAASASPIPPRKRGASALRILPVTAFVAALVLSVKVADLWENRQTLVETVTVGTVAMASGSDLSRSDASPSDQAAPSTGMTASQTALPPMQLAQATSGTASDDRVDPFNLGKSQIELLQSLADRRRELEERERTLVQREGLLAAAEHRIEQKIGELNGIKTEIEELIRKYDEQEEEQLSGLVKIYETMKPKDAAKIFDELDMEILLQVIERMKASKTAPVLAAMTPERAKEVTARIAERRKMPDIN